MTTPRPFSPIELFSPSRTLTVDPGPITPVWAPTAPTSGPVDAVEVAPLPNPFLTQSESDPSVDDEMSRRFGAWDSNRDGHLTRSEVEASFRNSRSPEERSTLATIAYRLHDIERASDDETGFEDDGATLEDFAAIGSDDELNTRILGQLAVDLAARRAVETGLPMPSLAEVSRHGFATWDVDANGALTASELLNAQQASGLPPEEAAALATLSKVAERTGDLHHADFTRIERPMMKKATVEFHAALDPSVERPADLEAKLGTRDYYIARYADFVHRNPDLIPPDYYLNYGLKYFDLFHAFGQTAEPKTRAWIDKTAFALQRKIEEEMRRDPRAFARLERDPGAFREFAYGTHPDAYIEAGLSDVSIRDQARIAGVPYWEDLLSREGLAQAAETFVRVAPDDVKKVVFDSN